MSSIVFIVDDHQEVAREMARLLGGHGLRSRLFDDPHAFLAELPPEAEGCVLLDLMMPGLSGLDVQQALLAKRIDLPVIFLTGHGDVETARNGLKAGAFDFIQKPVLPEHLLDVVRKALELDEKKRKTRQRGQDLETRLSRLTEREKEVASYIACGYTSKEIAKALQLSPRTIEAHRARIMIKVQADCLADLVSLITLYNRLKSAQGDAPLLDMEDRVSSPNTGKGARSLPKTLRCL